MSHLKGRLYNTCASAARLPAGVHSLGLWDCAGAAPPTWRAANRPSLYGMHQTLKLAACGCMPEMSALRWKSRRSCTSINHCSHIAKIIFFTLVLYSWSQPHPVPLIPTVVSCFLPSWPRACHCIRTVEGQSSKSDSGTAATKKKSKIKNRGIGATWPRPNTWPWNAPNKNMSSSFFNSQGTWLEQRNVCVLVCEAEVVRSDSSAGQGSGCYFQRCSRRWNSIQIHQVNNWMETYSQALGCPHPGLFPPLFSLVACLNPSSLTGLPYNKDFLRTYSPSKCLHVH